jgi:selenocysteine lyase/cysteine desulfurase
MLRAHLFERIQESSMQAVQPAVDAAALRRTEFPGVAEGIYMDAASMTPLPERTRRAVEEMNRRRSRIATLGTEELVDALRRARIAAARLVGAEPEEIALGWNTSFGINIAAQSLPVEPGATVVVSDREFPANVYPWMAMTGARLEVVPTDARGLPDEARILERLDRGDVSVFALSVVQFATGFQADVEQFGALCRARGIHFVVDAIQSLGQLPLDVRAAGVDVLACGGQKWLCSPFGTGFAYVRRELLERMEPRMVGWTGMRASADIGSLLDYRWEPRGDARRFEMSTLPFPDFQGFEKSLGLLMEVGVERIAEHLLAVQEPLVRWLAGHPEVQVASDLSRRHRSGILCIRPPEAEALHVALAEAGVVCALREGSLRFSPHLYNTPQEMETVVEVLEREMGR